MYISQPLHSPSDFDWRFSCAIVLIAEILTIMAFAASMPNIPFFLERELHVIDRKTIDFWTGMINAAPGVALALFTPLWGALADAYGKRLMLLRAMFGGAVAVGLMSLAQSPIQLLALRALQGCFTGSVAAATVMVAGLAPKASAGMALGLLQVSIYAGNSLGPMLGGFLYDRFAGRFMFMASACLLLLAGFLTRLFTPELPHAAAAVKPRISLIPDFSLIKASPLLLLLLMAIFLSQSSFSLVSGIMPRFIKFIAPQTQNIASIAGFVIGLSAAAAALGAVFFGWIGKKIKFQYIVLISFLGAAVCYVPQAFAGNWHFLLAFRLIDSFFVGGVMPSVNALLALHAPLGKQGAIFGLSSGLGSAGGALGPAMGALIAIAAGYRPVFILASLMLFILTFFLLAHRKRWYGRLDAT